MKVSIITISRNEGAAILDTLASVKTQNYPNIEHIVIDGASDDGTWDLIQSHNDEFAYAVSEPDNGIYDAMNKGLRQATGDIVGFLNGGDLLSGPSIIHRLVENFDSGHYDVIYGDKVYVDPADTSKILRYWKAGPYDPSKFRYGWMPPHLSTYIRRELYLRFGSYRTDLTIAADYELLLRFLFVNGALAKYYPHTVAIMRANGISNRNILNVIRSNWEARRSWRINGLRAPWLLPLQKPMGKVRQLWARPK